MAGTPVVGPNNVGDASPLLQPPVQVSGVDTNGAVRRPLLGTDGAVHTNLFTTGNVEVAFGTADDKLIIGGVEVTIARAFVNVAASQTDSVVVAAVVGKAIRVVRAYAQCGSTATSVTFNSKPAGAGTAISPAFQNGANGGEVLPFAPEGWFQTSSGEGLSVTTGAGSTTGIIVSYVTV